MPKPAGGDAPKSYITIPTVSQLKRLSYIPKETLLVNIVNALRDSARLGKRESYCDFHPENLIPEFLVEEVKHELSTKGYGVLVTRKYNKVSFIIRWD